MCKFESVRKLFYFRCSQSLVFFFTVHGFIFFEHLYRLNVKIRMIKQLEVKLGYKRGGKTRYWEG